LLSVDDSVLAGGHTLKIQKEPKRRESSVISTYNFRKFKGGDGSRRINNYIIEGTLGEGSFAKVKKCRHCTTGELYAIK